MRLLSLQYVFLLGQTSTATVLACVSALGPGPLVTFGVPDEWINGGEAFGGEIVFEESVACEVTTCDRVGHICEDVVGGRDDVGGLRLILAATEAEPGFVANLLEEDGGGMRVQGRHDWPREPSECYTGVHGEDVAFMQGQLEELAI